MQTINLKTTLTAYPKLSSSLLKDYATKDELRTEIENTRADIIENYVPEVSDRESDKVYARNGKDRKWVEVKDSAVIKDTFIYFGSNNLNKITSFDQIKSLTQDKCSYEEKTYTITYNQTSPGRFWICTTTPILYIQWGSFAAWTGYSRQTVDIIEDGTIYYCYYSDEIFTENIWEFKLTFNNGDTK